MTAKDLKKEMAYIEKQKKELLRDYLNKYILVHGEKVFGSFDSYTHAVEEGIRLFGAEGVFLVQQMLDVKPVNFVLGADL